MTEFNSEALQFIDNFISRPPENREQRVEMAQKTCDLLVSHKDQIEGVRSLNNFYTGAFIASLRVDEIWRSFPDNENWWNFEDFCKARLKMSLPKANTLERVWARATKAGMAPQEVEKIGWGTADAMLRFCTDRKDVDLLLTEMEKYPTRQEFVETLRTRKTNGVEGDAPEFKTQYRWNSEEYHTVNSILQEIAQSYGKHLGKNMRPEEALLMILVQWKQASEEGERNGRERVGK